MQGMLGSIITSSLVSRVELEMHIFQPNELWRLRDSEARGAQISLTDIS